MTDAPKSNVAEYSVSELSGALKRTIENEFGFVRVRGEISGYRGPHSSGHVYFSIKDASAKIDAVIWKGVFGRMRVRPEDGMEVIASGKITTFPGKSSYQIIVEQIEPAGVGALMALLEERRKKLAAEGLFDTARKRPIPYLPEVIGVVTSPTGAVIRDIIHRIQDRFPRHVLVWPVRVQGEGSAQEVAAAIQGFNALPAAGNIRRPDVIIVARGGGSLEDLWGFNDEAVARAAAASDIPLISAVGHETDWTLIDHAADLRAPTPTGAAEMCVPVRAELLTQLADLSRRHDGAMLRRLDRLKSDLRATARALPSGDEIVALPRQRLDAATSKLGHALRGGLDKRALLLQRVGGRLAGQSPQVRMARARAHMDGLVLRLERAPRLTLQQRQERLATLAARLVTALQARTARASLEIGNRRQRLDSVQGRLHNAFRTALQRRQTQLDHTMKLLASYDWRDVLKRGYAVVRDAEENPVTSAKTLSDGARFNVQFADGRVSAVAGGKGRPHKAKTEREQGSLF
ncbi:exodeoxyribonuclease VII large subunit [Methylovirgula sp. 4M-Z18]|uniref:exodeoxyribonuclease VII large subunit n=1 Tax=Methylovirgula sp. 4M-Z18 TaxID=2293567 RepID=UPI000E2E5A3A|nr:exodeoxyribonuclease VII large subunit [Methylovirgula sp. 4M-Z18]RFB79679.1 exodeoxyribonuclease VII large subunit [Methylovirgula sp. 4M-Z18]